MLKGVEEGDPAADFLAREHQQLGELEEEIGSLSGKQHSLSCHRILEIKI